MIFLSVVHAVAFKESLKKLNEGSETMENHLKLKKAMEEEDVKWRKAAKSWD